MSNTKGYSFKVKGGKFKGDLLNKYFEQNVVDVWNALSAELLKTGMIVMFRRHLDSHMNRQGIEAYRLCAGGWD